MAVLLQHWAVVLSLLTALTYVYGYLEAFRFLSVMRITIAPTEVYSESSLLAAGLLYLTTRFFIPIMSAGLGLLFSDVVPHNKKLLFEVLAVLSAGIFDLVRVAWAPDFPTIFPNLSNVSHLESIMMRFVVILLIFSMVFAASMLFARIWEGRGKTYVWLALALIWFSLMNYYPRRYVVFQGGSSRFFPRPGVPGEIVTSFAITSSSDADPTFGGQAFRTLGLLLARHDQTYYFAPLLSETAMDPRLIIVQGNEVLAFIQR